MEYKRGVSLSIEKVILEVCE